ncbi:24988_t:CDS:2 [Gigaspora margarita]|uniref:24988_t:CDS:1 n=1 Tax=Gigaspora margarita TaxID=4874 RepID=A0ABN7V9Q9_GIGMA|nr:24988_t:CDS:2 [Gigaspora margarita]
MKKIHNTRSKGEEMLTLLQITIPEVIDAKISAFQDISSASSTGRQFSHKKFYGFDIEVSGNLCNTQLGKMSSPDLQTAQT